MRADQLKGLDLMQFHGATIDRWTDKVIHQDSIVPNHAMIVIKTSDQSSPTLQIKVTCVYESSEHTTPILIRKDVQNHCLQ